MATILIVDDLGGNRQFLAKLLRSQGHTTLDACDGAEGLDRARTGHPDLIITDVLMPVMDGYELVKQLRLDPVTHRTPVVFYTAHYGAREARTLALSGGVCDVLLKPADAASLASVIARALAGAPSPPDPPASAALTVEFDREHLRLLTDKASEQASQVRAANARLRALINVSLDVAAERDAGRRLTRVCAATRDLFAATFVTVGIVDDTGTTVDAICSSGADAGVGIARGDIVTGALQTVMAERRTLRGENETGAPGAVGFPPGHPEIRAFLTAPIASPRRVFGWICLVNNEAVPFTDDDEQLVVALAGHVGRIYELEREILHRQRAETALRDERDRATRYLDTAEVILLALDVDGRIGLINRKGCDLLGWPAAELQGRTWFEFLPLRFRRILRTQFQDLLGGNRTIVESPVVTRSGAERLLEWRHTAVRDAAGAVIGTFSSGSDITDRKLAEDEIRQRARLSALAASIGLALIDAGTLSPALQRCADVLVTHLGASFARIWLLRDGEGVLELHASAGLYTHLDGPHGRLALDDPKIGRIARERKAHVTNTVIGEPRVVDQDWARTESLTSFAGFPLIVGDRVVGVMALFAREPLSDAVVAALASAADHIALGIDRYRSAEALRTAEERMRLAQQAAGVGIWDLDYSTGVLRWSDTHAAHYGMAPGTLDGTFDAFVERIHPEDRARSVAAVEDAMKSGAHFWMQHRALQSDGSVRWLTGAGRVHLDPAGQPVRGVGMSFDLGRRSLDEPLQSGQLADGQGRLAVSVVDQLDMLLTEIRGRCALLTSGASLDAAGQADVEAIHRAATRAMLFQGDLPPTPDDTAVERASAQAGNGAGETVLLIDDATGVRELVRRFLVRLGYTVLSAANAAEAVALFDADPTLVDVVLTDVVLPGGSGPEIVSQLRQRRPSLKVIYMSGYAEDGIVARGILNPGIAFLHKPFTADALQRRVREALDC